MFFVWFQVNEIKSRLGHLGDDEMGRVLLEVTTAIELEATDARTCTMKRRWTTKQLVASFCAQVEDAHSAYRQSMQKAIRFLAGNVGMAQKMDSFLGTPAADDDDTDDGSEGLHSTERRKANDGSTNLQCPVAGCSTRTFKLKRHLELKHKDLTPERMAYAVMAARKMDKNSELPEETPAEVDSTSSAAHVKKHAHQNTAMVSRRHNYKECFICRKLVMNMGEHLAAVHKITRDHAKYEHYVCDAPCVPKSYTKLESGVRVLLQNEELEEAQNKFGGIIETQQATLEQLKDLRTEMADVDRQINEAPTEEEYLALKKRLQSLETAYKENRYKDARTYTENSKKWHDSFLSHLQLRQHSNPKRGVNQAMDVLLPYEASLARPLVVNDLLDGVHMRKMLFMFKESASLKSNSKAKYLALFEMFLQFLFLDVESPERAHDDDIQAKLLRDASLTNAKQELCIVKTLLGKERGKDLAKSKAAAKKKLVTDDELDSLLADITCKLTMVLADSQEVRDSYSTTRILDVRNCLIAAGALRLGRRSKELMKMTTSEVDDAERVEVDGDVFHVVKVFDQKNIRVGEAAPVTFTAEEFKVLEIFIAELRPKIVSNKFEKNVFPPRRHMKYAAAKDLSFSSACRILKTFETKTGKKITSRTIRGSRITSNRCTNYSDKEKSDLAKAMSHSVATAERYYDYSDVTQSVSNSLSLSKARQSKSPLAASTPLGSLQEAEQINSPQPGPSGVRRRLVLSSPEPDSSSPTNKKRRISTVDDEHKDSEDNEDNECQDRSDSGDESDDDDDDSSDSASDDNDEEKAERTLITLRKKKIVAARVDAKEKEKLTTEIQSLIKSVVDNLRAAGNEKLLTTKTGALSIQPITKSLPKNKLRFFTHDDLRVMMKKALE